MQKDPARKLEKLWQEQHGELMLRLRLLRCFLREERGDPYQGDAETARDTVLKFGEKTLHPLFTLRSEQLIPALEKRWGETNHTLVDWDQYIGKVRHLLRSLRKQEHVPAIRELLDRFVYTLSKLVDHERKEVFTKLTEDSHSNDLAYVTWLVKDFSLKKSLLSKRLQVGYVEGSDGPPGDVEKSRLIPAVQAKPQEELRDSLLTVRISRFHPSREDRRRTAFGIPEEKGRYPLLLKVAAVHLVEKHGLGKVMTAVYFPVARNEDFLDLTQVTLFYGLHVLDELVLSLELVLLDPDKSSDPKAVRDLLAKVVGPDGIDLSEGYGIERARQMNGLVEGLCGSFAGDQAKDAPLWKGTFRFRPDRKDPLAFPLRTGMYVITDEPEFNWSSVSYVPRDREVRSDEGDISYLVLTLVEHPGLKFTSG